MLRTIGTMVIALAATPALASHGGGQARQIFTDAAAAPAYNYQHSTVEHRYYRHLVAHHYRPERHEAAQQPRHKVAPERLKVDAPLRPPAVPPRDPGASQALAVGAFLGLPDGWEEGVSAAIPQSIKDLGYLVARASDESETISRQSPIVAIGRLVPEFVSRLAAAFRDAEMAGLNPCVQSAYRPPGYGIGGFSNKYVSAHSYGLAADICGLDGPGEHAAILFRKIAAQHGVYSPYSVNSRSEFNHFEPTHERLVLDAVPSLRGTITADGPRDLERMWKLAESVVEPIGGGDVSVGEVRVVRHHYTAHHYATHRWRHTRYAGA